MVRLLSACGPPLVCLWFPLVQKGVGGYGLAWDGVTKYFYGIISWLLTSTGCRSSPVMHAKDNCAASKLHTYPLFHSAPIKARAGAKTHVAKALAVAGVQGTDRRGHQGRTA